MIPDPAILDQAAEQLKRQASQIGSAAAHIDQPGLRTKEQDRAMHHHRMARHITAAATQIRQHAGTE